tara:strand:+ start:3142 stop:3519 length:378 start_codon:yes stop_codon:yes gene_type:complete
MWLSLIKFGVSTAKEIHKNRQETKVLESVAEKRQMQRVIDGEIQMEKLVQKKQNNDFKDEFCLILLSLPLLILAYSVFFGDQALQDRVDYFFLKFENLPFWYQGLVIGAFSTILGIRGVSAIKKK